jgi:hypothetical protein
VNYLCFGSVFDLGLRAYLVESDVPPGEALPRLPAQAVRRQLHVLALQPGQLHAHPGPARGGRALAAADDARYVVFQLAEVAVPRALFAEGLRRITWPTCPLLRNGNEGDGQATCTKDRHPRLGLSNLGQATRV